MRTWLDLSILTALLPAVGCSTNPSLTKEQLGALVFSDASLSRPPGQSCADCHAARVAFRDPESYDRYLAGLLALTDAEQRGLEIFEDPARGNCAGCHPSRPGFDGAPPLFTDHSYANLGIPRSRSWQP